VTAVFAVYVLAPLVTLLFFRSVSDYLGPIPTIIAASALSDERSSWRQTLADDLKTWGSLPVEAVRS